jgi:hypothetical protein
MGISEGEKEMGIGITRQEKRRVQERTNYLFELLKITWHFFPDLRKKLSEVKDPRHKSYITYDPEELLLCVILKNILAIKSMRQTDEELNTETCIENIYRILSKERKENLPHHDTINDYLERLDVGEPERIRKYLITGLLRSRALEDYRLPYKRRGIIFDGSGLFKFNEKHCEHCLRREVANPKTGEKKTIYMHHVLEAKLLVGDTVLSIGSEFIENESEDVEKQDCERKAFYRLAERLKREYPKLPICIICDSLYACEPVFGLCDKYGWKFLIRFKDGSLPTVAAEAEAIRGMGEHESTGSDTVFINGVATEKRSVNFIEKTEVREKPKDDEEPARTFTYLTDMHITKGNAGELVVAGKKRWKIENEGFNVQKNHRCFIGHACSEDYTAMKNHYLLSQIAEILMQLYENGVKTIRTMNMGIKTISSLLSESIRTRSLTDEDITNLGRPIQIRFA